MSFAFLERIAEEKILEAARRGEFDHLPGTGKPLPEEDAPALVPPELRMAYRVLKNAGYVPEEVRLRREIEEVTRLLDLGGDGSPDFREGLARLHCLMQRLGEMRGGNLALDELYYRRCETGSNAKASESSSPRKPEEPGGFPTEETCKASRPGVESSEKPRSDPLVGSGRADGDGRGAEGNDRAGAESERAMNGPARLRSESGARSRLAERFARRDSPVK